MEGHELFTNIQNISRLRNKDAVFISGINHNVDELLVGVVTQLKLRKYAASEKTNKDKVTVHLEPVCFPH